MENWLDLHMHSCYSGDGEFAPAVLMDMCKKSGLRAVALADHNSVRGIAEARMRAQAIGLKYLSALEIDCTHNDKTFHLLGYGIDENDPVFLQLETDFHAKMKTAGRKLMELVKQQGFFFDEERVLDIAFEGEVAAEHIAEVMFADTRNDDDPRFDVYREGGSRSDNPLVNFFWDYCADGKPCNVPVEYPAFDDMVKAIQQSGGVAVLAHPGANIGRDKAFAESLIKTGIDGIEAYSNYHDEETRVFYRKLAESHKLIVTAGSDFHGKCKPSIHYGELSFPYPDKTVESLNALIEARGGKILK